MGKFISVVIPNYNGSATIGNCLDAVFSSKYDSFEVIVVDDCSTDCSREIIKKFPCKLIELDKHSGASRARNIGARNSSGKIIFFMDADCIAEENTLTVAVETITRQENTVVGGTYTMIPYDDNFFSSFQSIFINYFETRKKEPDYIAAHGMLIDSVVFDKSGGFSEDFLPIIEDVEFCHRLRKSGYRLIMNPDLLVRHVFNFTLFKSLKNAFRKAKFWTVYSLSNKDLFADSGTASIELKINSAFFLIDAVLISVFLLSGKAVFLFVVSLILIFNLYTNRGLINSFYKAKGALFAVAATAYYIMLYPAAVGAGSFAGALKYLSDRGEI